MEVTRIFDLLDRYITKFPKDDAFAGKEEGEWMKYSTRSYVDISNYISYGFIALGVQKGDKIATITYNRPEWNFLDMGIAQIGAIHIPIYPTISEADYKYILNHAEIKYVFVAGEDMFRKIENILPEVTTAEEVSRLSRLVKGLIVRHAEIEDNLVFVTVDHALENQGKLHHLHQEHQELGFSFECIAGVKVIHKARNLLKIALQVSREHFEREEFYVFPIIELALQNETLGEMGKAWTEKRGGSNARSQCVSRSRVSRELETIPRG